MLLQSPQPPLLSLLTAGCVKQPPTVLQSSERWSEAWGGVCLSFVPPLLLPYISCDDEHWCNCWVGARRLLLKMLHAVATTPCGGCNTDAASPKHRSCIHSLLSQLLGALNCNEPSMRHTVVQVRMKGAGRSLISKARGRVKSSSPVVCTREAVNFGVHCVNLMQVGTDLSALAVHGRVRCVQGVSLGCISIVRGLVTVGVLNMSWCAVILMLWGTFKQPDSLQQVIEAPAHVQARLQCSLSLLMMSKASCVCVCGNMCFLQPPFAGVCSGLLADTLLSV